MVKIQYSLHRGNKKSEKFLAFKIIAYDPGSTNSDILEEDTCHCQSICYQATLTFRISLREVYSKAGSPRVMKKIMKCSPEDFTRGSDNLTCSLSKGVLKRCFSEIGLTKSLTVWNFGNKVGITIILILKMLKT